MSRLIWIYAVCKSLSLSPVAVKENKTYSITCATSEDSDQLTHPRMCLSHPPSYLKRDKGVPMPFREDVQAELCLCSSHKSYCRFCHPLAHSSVVLAVLAVMMSFLSFKSCRFPFYCFRT